MPGKNKVAKRRSGLRHSDKALPVLIITALMRTEIVLQTSVPFIHLTRLIAREDFIGFRDGVPARSVTKLTLPMCNYSKVGHRLHNSCLYEISGSHGGK
jgi:hypothetical protein